MPDDGRRCERRVGAANPLGDLGMKRGHSLHVGFVNYEILPRNRRLAIATPVVRRTDHHTLGHRRRAVSRISTKRSSRAARAIPEHRIVPLGRAIDRTRIRIEQQLRGIEAMPRGRIVGAADAIAVALSRTNARSIRMPYMLGPLDERYPGD